MKCTHSQYSLNLCFFYSNANQACSSYYLCFSCRYWFCYSSPQDSSSGDELDFGIPNDEQPPPGIDNLSLTGGSDESDEVAILGDPDNEPMAVLVRRRRGGASRFLARLGRNRLRKLRKMKKPLQAPPSI
ncbi:hypothetical protein RMCBS344292_17059 [Rhizopus microsporus]|nr:hypothetical protein RMCBS344292_17059 [Rhizopus microsporus]